MESKVNVIAKEGATEVVLREGKARELLPEKAPIKLNLKGNIQTIFRFLSIRLNQFDHTKCHILVSRDTKSITLIINEDDDYTRGVIKGVLEQDAKFLEFGVNEGKRWNPSTLGQFFKMNRACFPDRAKNMELVTVLKNFEAKVNQNIEKTKNDNGSFIDNFSAVVTSNLPSTFMLNVPVIKGMPPTPFEVEFYAEVDGRNIHLYLVSPTAQEITDISTNELIDAEINQIRSIVNTIPILEI